MGNRVTIYADEGAGDFSLFCARRFFEEMGASVRQFSAADIIGGKLDNVSCDIFVMPGGADLPYCKKLNGAGNETIRRFVEQGGTYFGICAGAYYGCRDIAFHQGRADEITGARELALIDATAYGSLPELAGYYDDTLATAKWVGLTDQDARTAQSYYHGGCAFDVRDPEAVVLARYADLPDHPPAIIAKQIGKGRALLSGAHVEATPSHLQEWAKWENQTEAAQALSLALSVASAPLFSLISQFE